MFWLISERPLHASQNALAMVQVAPLVEDVGSLGLRLLRHLPQIESAVLEEDEAFFAGRGDR